MLTQPFHHIQKQLNSVNADVLGAHQTLAKSMGIMKRGLETRIGRIPTNTCSVNVTIFFAENDEFQIQEVKAEFAEMKTNVNANVSNMDNRVLENFVRLCSFLTRYSR